MKFSTLRSPINGQLEAKSSNLQRKSFLQDYIKELKQRAMARKRQEVSQKQNVTSQELKELFGDAFGKMKVSRECEERLFNQENDFNHGN